MHAGQSTGLAFGPARCPGQVGLHDVPLGTCVPAFRATLLDQKVIAGIGNIYASEILYRSKIHPLHSTRLLSSKRAKEQLGLLLRSTVEILENAVYPLGEPATLRDEFRVYEKEGTSCSRRGCGGKIRRQAQNGRSSYFCPRCQKR